MHKRILNTEYISIDTGMCIACWKCVEICGKKVIGKVDLFFHKHARLKKPQDCSGCLRCAKVCGAGSIGIIKFRTKKQEFLFNNISNE